MATKPDGSIIIEVDLNQDKFEKSVSGLAGKAAKAAAAIGTAIGAVSIAAIKVGSDFEEGMSKVAAISGATGEDLNKLKDKAMEMGAKTKFSATEASEALQYMAMAGWKTEDMLDGLEGIMNLAAASGEDLASTSDIVTDALTAFGLSAKDSTRFADVLAAASSNANTNVGMMGETFKYVAPVAGALGFSVEDTAVAIGLMANAGIKGSQAGTALRSMLSRLAKPTDDVAAAMETLGISLTNSDGTMKSFNEITLDLRSSFGKLNQAQKTEMAATLAGQEAMSGLLAIVNASDADFDKLKKSIDNSSGSAKKMADTMNNNLKGKLTIIGSTLEGIGIKAYDKFEKPLSKALDSAQKSLNNLDKSMSSGKLGKSVDKLAEGFGKLVEVAINLATKILPVAIDAFALLADNSELVVGAITTVTTAYLAYTKIVKPAVEVQKILAAAESASTVAMSAKQVIVGLLTRQISLHTAATTASTTATSAWNAVMAANPMALVITGVVTLTAGIAALAIAHGEEKTAIQEFNEELEEEAESFREVQKAAQEQGEANLAEINNIQKMKDELDLLVDANGKVKEGFESRASYLVNELAEATGADIKLVDGQIQKYSELSNEIQKSIDKMRAEAILEAHKDEYTTAVEKQADAQKKYNKALESYNKEMSNANKWIKDYEDSLKSSNMSQAEIQAEASRQWQAHISDYKSALDKAQKNYENYTSTIVSYEQAEADVRNGNFNTYMGLLNQESSMHASSVEEKKKRLAEEIKVEQDTIETLKKQKNKYNQETTDSKIAAAEKNIETTRNEMQQLVAEVVTASPKYAEALMNMVSNGEKVFDDNGNLTDEAQKKLVDVFTTQNNLAPEYSKILTKMANSGKAVFDSNGELTSAAQKKLINAYATANNLAPKYVTALEEMAENGERVFDSSGSLTSDAQKKIQDAIQGANGKKKDFNTTLSNIAKDGEYSFATGANFWSSGYNAAAGIASGVGKGGSSVQRAFKGLANIALSSFNATLEIHSPSRKFMTSALYAIQGIVKGAKDNAYLAVDAYEDIADDVLDTFENVKFDKLLDSFDSSQINRMVSKINSAVQFEQMKMNGAVEVKGQYEIDKAVAELKQSDRPLKGVLQGVVKVITNIDGREAAITLAPLVSEEIEFNS